MKCLICQNSPAERHHFIRRWLLTKEEQRDERYTIPLCRKHHQEIHFSPHTSGLKFYEKYCLLDLICNQCGFDNRLLRWIESQRYKERTL